MPRTPAPRPGPGAGPAARQAGPAAQPSSPAADLPGPAARQAGPAARQGGDLRHLPARQAVLDLGTCVNRYGPPPSVRDTLAGLDTRELRAHPYEASERFTAAYAQHMRVRAAELLVGRGITEFLTLLAQLCPVEDTVVITPDYTDTIRLFPRHLAPEPGTRDTVAARTERVAAAMARNDYVVLSNPNNPLGLHIPCADLRRICAEHPAATLIVDEAYADFMAGPAQSMTSCGLDNVVVLQSPNKLYGTAGVRTGGLWTHNSALREAVRRPMPNWPLSYLDAAVATAALRERDWAVTTRARLLDTGKRLAGLLADRFGDAVERDTPVHYRFVHAEDPHPVYERLAEAGVIVRIFSGADPGRVPGFRIVAPTEHEMGRVEEALARLAPHPAAAPPTTPIPPTAPTTPTTPATRTTTTSLTNRRR